MATSVEQKVVQLKFDNRDFEKNTKQTMSTLDKLKAKLNFKDTANSLDNGMVAAIETVNKKFSIMEVVGVTALVNITNSAINAGKQIAKALTIDQVWSGWDKMSQQMGYVQTLVNSTGKSVDEIEEYLEQLQWYSDETSYSFTEMAQALASMSSVGGDLDRLLPTITGIANATAFAGKGANEFSRVIFNLGQAYGLGYLSLADWKSIELAGVNSKQLVEEIIKSGEELGTVEKGRVTTKNFRNSLGSKSEGYWVTTEVMEHAFSKFSALSDAVYREVQNGADETASEIIDRIATVDGKFTQLSIRAFRSAQEAKTFKESLVATADAVSSAWMKIFKSIFGNYNQQKEIFTDLANFLYDYIVEPLNTIQAKINTAFNFKFDSFNKLFEKIDNFKKLNEQIEEYRQTLMSVEKYQKIVNKVWNGDYNNRGDKPDRFYLLRKEGYNPSIIQNLVNYGDSYKLTAKEVINAENKWATAEQRRQIELYESEYAERQLAKQTEILSESYDNLTEEQLEEIGLSKEEIELFKSLQIAAKKYGISIEDLYNKLSEGNAHDFLFGKFHTEEVEENGKKINKRIYDVKGAFQYLGDIIESITTIITEAWRSVFPEKIWIDILFKVRRFRDFLKGISESLEDVTTGIDENGDEIKEHNKTVKNMIDTLRGLFSILKLIKTFVGGAFTIVWTVFKTVLETFGLTVLDFTGMLGNMIATFTDFVTKNEFIIKGIKKVTITITNFIKNVYNSLYNWISLNGIFEKVKNTIITVFNAIKGFVQGFKGKELKDIPKYIADNFLSVGKWIFEGLKKGIKDNGGSIINVVKTVALSIIQVFKDIFQIHSPSKTMFDIAGNIIFGLIDGIKSAAGTLFEIIKALGQKILQLIKNFDIGSFITVALTSLTAIITLKTVKIVNDIVKIIGGFADAVSDVLRSAAGLMNALKVRVYVDAVQVLVKSILLIVAAIVVLSAINRDKVGYAVGVITAVFGMIVVLLGAIIGLAVVVSKTNTSIKDIGSMFLGIAAMVLSIGASLLLVSIAMKKIDNVKNWYAPLIAFGTFILLIIGLFITMKVLSKGGFNSTITIKCAGLFLAVAALMLVMGHVVKKIGKLSTRDFKYGMIGMIACFGLILVLMVIMEYVARSSDPKVMSSISLILLSFGGMFLLFSMALKKMGKLSTRDFTQGLIGIGVCLLMLIGLLVILKKLDTKGKNSATSFTKISNILIKVAGAILMLSIAVKILGSMNFWVMMQGILGVTLLLIAIGGLIVGLNKLISKDSKNVGKASAIILAIAAAITILSLSVKILGSMKLQDIAQGLTAIATLMLLLKVVIDAASNLKAKTLGVILGVVGAIVMLVAAVVILSHMDLTRTAIAVGELTVLMLALSLLLKTVSKFAKTNWKKVLTVIGEITLILGVLVGTVWLLSTFDASKAIPNAIATGVLLLAIMASMKVISNTKLGKDAFTSLSLILGIVGIVAILGFVLSSMQNIQNGVTNAIALSILLGAITLVLIGLNAINKTGGMNFKAIGKSLLSMIGIIAVMVILAGALHLVSGFNINADNMSKILICLTWLTLLMGPLALIGMLGAAAYIGLGALAVFIVELTAIIIGLGALFSKIKELSGFMETGGKVLVKLGEIIGEFIGTLIASLSKKIMEILPALGQNLSDFAIAADPFIQKMKEVGIDVLKGASFLTLAILELSAAAFINGINRLLSIITLGGDNPLWRLGKNLSDFAIASKEFIDECKKLPLDGVNAIRVLCDAIMVLTKASLLDTITSFLSFGRKNSIARFGSQLGDLGKGLKSFNEEIKGISKNDSEKASTAAEIIKTLASASKEMPKSGGIFGWLTGNKKDLAAFTNDMPKMAKGTKEFIQNLGNGLSNKSIELSETASKIIVNLAKAAKEMPKEGGLFQAFAGTNKDLKEFTDNMPAIGTAVSTFMKNIKIDGNDFTDAEIRNVDTLVRFLDSSLNALSTIRDLLTKKYEIETSKNGYDGFLINNYEEKTIVTAMDSSIDSIMDFFSTLGQKIAILAPAIKDFIKSATSMVGDNDAAIKKAELVLSVIEGISELIQSLDPSKFQTVGNMFGFKSIYDDLKDFISYIPDISTEIKKFIENTNNVGSYDDKKIRDIIDYLKGFAVILSTIGDNDVPDNKKLDSFQSALGKIGYIAEFVVSDMLNDVKSYSEDNAKKVKGVIENVLTPLVDFVSKLSKMDDATTATSNLLTISNSLKTMKDNLPDFIRSISSLSDNDIKSAKDKVSGIMDIVLETFNTVGKDPKTKIHDGIFTLFNDALKSIKDNKDIKTSTNEAGGYIINVFCESVNSDSNKTKLKTSINTMAKNAIEYLKNALRVESPSKETAEVGMYFVDGFIVGIQKKLDESVKEVAEFGKKQNEALKNSLINTSIIADSDMEIKPVISPVIDLTDFNSGINKMNGAFTDPILNARNQANNISNNLNNNSTKNRFGLSDAVDMLGKKLDNITTNSYTINGITYGSDSAIGQAIDQLVRAVQIDGRS